ncbi:hypothetical protein [Nitrosomonas sp.]|nr:hypothetical protein [Nitrosomonas sp.]
MKTEQPESETANITNIIAVPMNFFKLIIFNQIDIQNPNGAFY